MKKNYQLIFLTSLSALLLSSAFFLPVYFASSAFIFLIPLYYGAIKYPYALNYNYGLLWGILFFATHSSGVAYLCIEHGHGILKFVAGLFITFYFSLYAVAWFGAANYCSSKFKNSIVWLSLCWIAFTFIFFYIYKYHSWWVFGIYHNGYCFASPLLVLAEFPKLLNNLNLLGESGLILLLLISQLWIALAFVKKKYSYLAGAITFLPFFFSPLTNLNESSTPYYVQELGYIKPHSKKSPLYCIEQAIDIDCQIDALIYEFPHIKHIIMPEVSLRTSINCYPELIDVLTEHTHNKNINLFIGAHRTIDERKHNSLYLIRHGEINNVYDKQLRMPFMEYIPFPWNYISGCQELFLKDWSGFESSQDSAQELEADNELHFIPCICSELFFGNDEIFKKQNNNSPILVVANETWFSADYLKHLMFLYARYKAIQYKKDIIFVCHSHACWINKNNGDLIHLHSN